MLKKIKIYNLNEYIERHLIEGKKYIVFDFSTGIGIIEGSNGVITIDSEGVGYNLSNIEEEFKIGINNQPKNSKSFYIMPQHEMSISSKEIIGNCNYKEMLLTEFITRYNYNSRLKENFIKLLKAINDIGLNSKDYYKNEERV